MKATVFSMLIAAGVLAATAPEARAEFLSGRQIADLFNGTTFDYWRDGKTEGTSSYTARRFEIMDETGGASAGTWWIREDTYCRRIENGHEHCDRVRDNGDGTYSSRGYTFAPR